MWALYSVVKEYVHVPQGIEYSCGSKVCPFPNWETPQTLINLTLSRPDKKEGY